MAKPVKRIQYSVDFSSESCVDSVRKCLHGVGHSLKIVKVSLEDHMLILDTNLACQTVSDLIQSVGKTAVLVGVGNIHSNGTTKGCAVCMLGDVKSGGGFGVIRMLETDHGSCIFDGTIDGLHPNQKYTVAIHEFGDISQGNRSCGEIISSLPGTGLEPLHNRGVITANKLASSSGRISFIEELYAMPLWALIGRSVVIHLEGTDGENLAVCCGIIARAAGLFQNPKKICACDGVTLWEERNVPLAGGDRNKFQVNANL